MRIVTLNGSPRGKGNTMALAEAVLAAMRGEKTIIAVHAAGVLPCPACGRCAAGEGCALDGSDGMGAIRAALRGADRLIIASPLHFSSLTAPLVAMFSRLQPEWRKARSGAEAERDRKGALVVTGGSLYPNMFEAGRIVAAAVFRALGFVFAGMAAASDTDLLPAGENQPALERAGQLGLALGQNGV